MVGSQLAGSGKGLHLGGKRPPVPTTQQLGNVRGKYKECENCQLRKVNDSTNILDSHLTGIRIKLIRIRTEHLATLLKLGFFPFLSPKQSFYRLQTCYANIWGTQCLFIDTN